MVRRLLPSINFIEVLLVVAITLVLAGIFIMSIVPNKKLEATRNEQRTTDITTILSAVYQYSFNHKGVFPFSISLIPTEICKTGAQCTNLVDLKVLTANEEYLVEIPVDPLDKNANGTGYKISKTPDGKVIVSAPLTESVPEISISK